MPSASMYVTIKRQLVSQLQARLASPVEVFYAWMPGRAMPLQAVWLENLPDLAASDTPLMQGSQRHARDEQWRVGLNCQAVDGGVEKDRPDLVEEQAALLMAAADGLFADDKFIGLGGGGGLIEAKLAGFSPAEPVAAGKGWAFRFAAEAWFHTWLT
jgi:hypothetical protein